MLTLGESVAALYGAVRLARLDARGLQYFDRTVRGFWRSFYAALIVAPFYATVLAMRYLADLDGASALRFTLVETVAYVVGWVAFPVLMATVCRALDREGRFVGYIVVYNWAAVLQNAAYLPLAMLAIDGVAPSSVANPLALGMLALILAYGWFIARVALEVTALAAAGIVALDLALSILINAVADRMV